MKAMLVYLAMIVFTYFILIGEPLWSGFFHGMWIRYNNPVVTLLFPFFIVIDAIFSIVPYIVYRRRRNDIVRRQSNTALIIPCHKAERVVGKTLENALKIFDAASIFVIDNGSSDTPVDGTKDICIKLGVNYTYLPIGHKSAAIYTGALLAKDYEYILQIDDDMQLDENMSFPITENTHCLAYTISATNLNGEEKLIHKFQDVEYKMAGIMKAFESWVGSANFPHGAISLWKRTTLIDVMHNHPMFPMSDDWFTGWVCNQMGYRIETCDSNFTKTDVPSIYFLNETDSRQSGYGSSTLFAQRFGRWYGFTVVQWFYMMYSIIFNWKLPFFRAVSQKLIWMWQIVRFNLVVVRYMFFAFNFHLAPAWSGYMLIVVVVSSQFTFILTNYKHLDKHERFPVYMVLLLPIYNLFDSLCFMLGMYWSTIAYIPFAITAPSKKLKGDLVIQNIVNSRL